MLKKLFMIFSPKSWRESKKRAFLKRSQELAHKAEVENINLYLNTMFKYDDLNNQQYELFGSAFFNKDIK